MISSSLFPSSNGLIHFASPIFMNISEGVAINKIIRDENKLPFDYIIIDVNSAYEKFLNLKRYDVINKRVSNLYDGNEVPYLKEVSSVMATGNSVRFISYFKPLEKYFDIIIIPLAEDYFATIFFDITEHKLREETLRESDEKFRNITISAQDAIIIMDNSGNISYWNPASEKILGYSCDEIIGKNLHYTIAPERFHKDYNEAFSLWQTTGQGNAVGKTIELVAKKKDGSEIDIELSLSSVKISNSWHAIGILRDITGRKTSEDEKHRLEEQLRHRQKMEAIGNLAGGIAHDFNNILGGIIGYAELALFDVEKDASVYTYLTKVLQGGKRAKELVKQILTFSCQAEGDKKPVNLNQIVQEVMSFMRASLPSNIDIVHNFENNHCIILADPIQIHQVLINLCTNSSHAMKEKGGKLEINLSKVTIRAKHPMGLKPGRYVKLSVKDTGHGMDKSVMERIFEPYFTTKDSSEGSGLGLAVIHGIVKSYDGAIRVESEPDKGTLFDIYFPGIEVELTPEVYTVETVVKGMGKVLYVDDETDLCYVIKGMLEKLGYEVTAANNAMEALDLFKFDTRKFDIIITDQTMPKMTGAELAIEVLNMKPEMPIILCTGFSEVINRQKAEAIGIREFIIKPINIMKLSKTIQEILKSVRREP